MHDNARAHTARVVTDYSEAVNIQRLLWSSQSAALNLIEDVWYKLKRRIRSRTTINDPKTVAVGKTVGVGEYSSKRHPRHNGRPFKLIAIGH